MALIICPECKKEISDKANTCIHCGYPLSAANSTNSSVASVKKQNSAEEKLEQKEYSIKIISCNGSNAKVIITLKNKFQYSLDDAKRALTNLPLTVTFVETLTELKKIAQEFTDAGIDYEIFEDKEKISLNLTMTDKVVKPTHKSNYYSVFKRCPSCGWITDNSDMSFCPRCHVPFVRIPKNQEYRIQSSEIPVENKNIPKCPTCESTDIKKISVMSKAGSAFLWGIFAVGKVSKQWHCNNCGSEW